MTNDMLRITDRVTEAWNKHDVEKFLADCDESIVWSTGNVPSETFKGKNEVREFFNNWKRAFPDLHLQIRNRITGEELVAVEYEFTGTQNGPLRTRKDMPEIAPSHKSATVYGCYMAKVKNGKIIQVTNYPDRFTLLDRLGVLSEMYHAV
jgi:steroid delta-isomerase-like uncharacterized protein